MQRIIKEAFQMKVLGNVLKILAALAAIAGVVYVVATYGDKIVAWAKKLLNKTCCDCCQCEAVEEEIPVEEAAGEVAEETDFEG